MTSFEDDMELAGWGQLFLQFIFPALLFYRLGYSPRFQSLSKRVTIAVFVSWMLNGFYRSGVILPLVVEHFQTTLNQPKTNLSAHWLYVFFGWILPLKVCLVCSATVLIYRLVSERIQRSRYPVG